ncbi:hypothetical protein, variant [Puccinia striiformis f. sp. tritici PST-78]|uniref:Uncharacterized protein n=1 Tax=Puccinia striiformis f. sp. tritici PST-78 TaxID=1165861 RepID=A0A0L0V9J3_9BASI|nr:hypothetical protein PSTG_11019 [Puccinia striiformis f. sp. tritici PST-78]KNE95655.1 hypothetical protein, variant [Puccinia striiformis f. sp. tritici PST-78]
MNHNPAAEPDWFKTGDLLNLPTIPHASLRNLDGVEESLPTYQPLNNNVGRRLSASHFIAPSETCDQSKLDLYLSDCPISPSDLHLTDHYRFTSPSMLNFQPSSFNQASAVVVNVPVT